LRKQRLYCAGFHFGNIIEQQNRLFVRPKIRAWRQIRPRVSRGSRAPSTGTSLSVKMPGKHTPTLAKVSMNGDITKNATRFSGSKALGAKRPKVSA
jgi:hypothetical protein